MMVISGGFGSPLVSGGEEDDVISLRRDLEGRHIFAFTISAIIGAGFYIRTGTVEAIGGPGAVIVAYSLLGVLALAISQDLATMLHCWPIPGASFTFIRDFFDPDFAWISGWLYLLTHGCCLAALLGTIGDLVDSLNPSGGMSILVKTIAILFPTLVNLADIRYLKEVQFGAAIFKLLLALIMIVGMLWINPTVASASIHDSHLVKKERIFFDKGPGGYFGTISIAVFNLCFSFIGIEVAAALAIETNVTQSKHTDRIPGYEPLPEEYDLRQAGTQGKDPFHLSAILVPLTVVVIYVSGAWAVTENITHYDNRLPSLDGGSNASHSPFISSGQDYSEKLGKTITISIILILESTAIASLYVVSRSLYGLALVFSGHADGTADNPNEGCRLKALFLVLSHRSDFHVPWVAVLVSAALPIVLPLFKYTWPDVIGPVRLKTVKKSFSTLTQIGPSFYTRGGIYKLRSNLGCPISCHMESL
jgi:amino acid transporter